MNPWEMSVTAFMQGLDSYVLPVRYRVGERIREARTPVRVGKVARANYVACDPVEKYIKVHQSKKGKLDSYVVVIKGKTKTFAMLEDARKYRDTIQAEFKLREQAK